jgi:DNA-binding MarR family transcriptional regulator
MGATAKLVYLVLNDHGPATVDTLQATAGQSRRTVVEALGDLEDKNLVTARPDETDPRRQVWEPAE